MCSEVVCGGSSSYSMVCGPTDSPRLSMGLKGQSCFPETVLKRFTALSELTSAVVAKVLRSAHSSELGHWTVLVITPPNIHIENKHLFQQYIDETGEITSYTSSVVESLFTIPIKPV